MRSHIFRIWGVEIFCQVGSIKPKYRTICGPKMRIKYVFYIQFNKCDNPFYNHIVKRIYNVDA